MHYYWIKLLHLSTVVFTVAFFALRYYWMLRRSRLAQAAWGRYLSVVNDTLLLLAGSTLAVLSRQYPFDSAWLTAKLAALVVYILLGSMALKYARRWHSRAIYGALALLCAGYMILVAVSRSPSPWTVLSASAGAG